MKGEKIKNILLIILFLIIVALVVYIFLTSTPKKSDFINSVLEVQEKVSYYLGQKNSETFNAYNNIHILTGFNEDEEIKNIEGTTLVPLANKDSKIEKDGKVYYKLLEDKVKEVLKVDISKYSNLTWYIQDGELIRVDFETEPEWWNEEFDTLKIHK